MCPIPRFSERLRAFAVGIRTFRSSYDAYPDHDYALAQDYEDGRQLAHLLTGNRCATAYDDLPSPRLLWPPRRLRIAIETFRPAWAVYPAGPHQGCPRCQGRGGWVEYYRYDEASHAEDYQCCPCTNAVVRLPLPEPLTRLADRIRYRRQPHAYSDEPPF